MEGETTASFKVIFAPNLPSAPPRSVGGGWMSICINRNLACHWAITTKVRRYSGVPPGSHHQSVRRRPPIIERAKMILGTTFRIGGMGEERRGVAAATRRTEGKSGAAETCWRSPKSSLSVCLSATQRRRERASQDTRKVRSAMTSGMSRARRENRSERRRRKGSSWGRRGRQIQERGRERQKGFDAGSEREEGRKKG